MNQRKKKNRVLLLIILLLAVTVGYAALSTQLKINGTANIQKNTWSVYWDSVGNIQKSDTVTVEEAANVDEDDKEQVNFSVILNQPGDFYEFQVDAVNAGSLDAMVSVVSKIVNDDEEFVLPPYIDYSVTYADGGEIAEKQLLKKADQSTTPSTPTRERYKVRVEYKTNISIDQLNDMNENGEEYTFAIKSPYIQATKEAYDRDPCPGCVYSYYTEEHFFKTIGYAQPLTETENSFTALKRTTITDGDYNYESQESCESSSYHPENCQTIISQRKAFLAYILDENKYIERAFTCAIRNNRPYCIEGLDSSAEGKDEMFTANASKIKEAWKDDIESCTESEGSISCSKEGISRVSTSNQGGVEVAEDNDSCWIAYDGGIMKCSE